MGIFYSTAKNLDEGMTDMRSNLLPQMSELTKKMNEYFSLQRLGDKIREKINIDKVVSVILSIINIYRHTDIVNIISNVTVILCQLGIVENVLSPLVGWIYSKLTQLRDVRKAGTFKPEGELNNEETTTSSWREWFVEFKDTIMEKVFSIIGVVMKVIATGKMPSEAFNTSLTSWAQEARKWWSIRQGVCAISNIVDWIIKSVKFIFDKIMGYEDPNYVKLKQIEQYSIDVSEWVRKVWELDSDFTKTALQFDPSIQDTILELASCGYKYMELYCVAGAPGVVVSSIRDAQRIITGLKTQVEQARKCSTGRKEPFAVYLAGESGIGKTFYAECLLNELSIANAGEAVNRIYSRLPHTKHWDGYTGTQGVLFDDLGQEKDNEQDVAEWFRAKSTAVFIPPMADVADKGKHFTSSYLVATSNSMFLRPQSISSHEALWRRRDIAAWVRVKPEFRKPASHMLDPCKAVNGYEHLEFCILRNPAKTSPDPGDNAHWIPETEFRQLVITTQKNFDNMQEKMMKFKQEKFKTGFRPQALETDFKAVATCRGFDVRMLAMLHHDGDVWDMKMGYPKTPDHLAVVDPEIVKLVPMDDLEVIVWEFQGFYRLPQAKQDEIMAEFIAITKEKKPDGPTRMEKIKERVIRMKEALKQWIDKLYPAFWKALKIAGQIGLWVLYMSVHTFILCLSVFAGLVVFQKAVQWCMGDAKEELISIPEAYPSGDERTKALKKRVVKTSLTPEGSSDFNALEIIKSRVIPGLIRVRNERFTMSAFNIVDRIYLMPKHFFVWDGKVMNSKPGTQPALWFERGGTWIPVAFDERNLYLHPDRDLALYCLPASVQAGKKSTHLFVNEDQLAIRSSFTAQLVSLRENTICQNLFVSALDAPVHSAMDGYEVYIRSGWMYKAQTAPGDCGSMLVAFDTGLPKKLVGMHVSGKADANLGISEIITEELLEGMLQNLQKKMQQSLLSGVTVPQYETTPQALESLAVVPCGDFTILGKATKAESCWQPFKTNIEPSLIHDEVRKHVTEPAALHPADPRLDEKVSPLGNAISKYGSVQMPFIVEDVKAAESWLTGMIMAKCNRNHARVLNDDEVINGNPLLEYCDSMNMQSSPGYPYVLEKHRGSGKSWMFTGDPGSFVMVHSQALAKYKLREELASQGYRIESIWLDCLKDERRPIEKVKTGKTRAFTIPPVDYTMLARKYYLMFCVAFYEARLNIPSGVGIDCESFEWTRLFHYLRGNSAYGFDGDFSSFDGTMSPELMRVAVNVINKWYGGTDQQTLIRVVLGDEMIHTIQMATNCVYMTHRGNPSGNPMTVIINSMVNMCYMFIMWRLTMRVNGLAKYQSALHFENNVRFLVYGDDNIVTVKLPFLQYFNFQTVSQMFAIFGYKYTVAAKTTNPDFKWKNLTELTFLKRGFRQHPHQHHLWLPLISKDTIYELLNWVRKSEDCVVAMVDNIHDALNFMHFYGRKEFKEFKRLINAALERKNLPYRITVVFDDFDRGFLEKTGI